MDLLVKWDPMMAIFCSHAFLLDRNCCPRDFITANIITRVLFIIHCFILFIVYSSTVVGRISNVFI